MQNFKSLGHNDAEIAINAIKKELIARKQAAVIAVAGIHGELIGLLCLDGAKQASIQIAANKAWTASRERTASGDLGRKARNPDHGFDFAFFGDSRYLGWGGGLPVVLARETIGAVAVSGLTEALDTEYAQLGVDAILASLQ